MKINKNQGTPCGCWSCHDPHRCMGGASPCGCPCLTMNIFSLKLTSMVHSLTDALASLSPLVLPISPRHLFPSIRLGCVMPRIGCMEGPFPRNVPVRIQWGPGHPQGDAPPIHTANAPQDRIRATVRYDASVSGTASYGRGIPLRVPWSWSLYRYMGGASPCGCPGCSS